VDGIDRVAEVSHRYTFVPIRSSTPGMSGVTLDPDDMTATATRSLRTAGSSLTLTVPPEMLDLLKAEQGDDLQLVAHMDTGVIEVSKVEDGED